MLYRERTPAEWARLPPLERLAVGRGNESDYGFVADERAMRDAALGAAVRESVGCVSHDVEMCRTCARLYRSHNDLVTADLWDTIADALAAEEAGNG